MNEYIPQADKEFILKELKRYETPISALIPSLFCIQKRHGWVPAEAVKELSLLSDLPESRINEVLNFYTMFNKKPVGQLHVQVCCNVSCAMNGGRELAKHICETYKVGFEQVSPCGTVTVSPVECLGACDKAPMMQVGQAYYEDLTNESALEVLEKLAFEKAKVSAHV